LAGGGFSITGGLIGGFLGGFIYARLAKMDFYGIFARLSPSVLLGQAIGRLGCFLNGDAHGTATDLPWGVEFPRYGVSVPSFQLNQTLDSPAWQWAAANNHIASPDAIRTLPLHPTQLYEAFFDLGLGLGIWWLANFLLSNKKSAKIIFYIHTGGYALFRALVEYIRGDRRVVLALDTSLLQYTFFAVSIFAFVKIALEAISLSKPEAALKNS
jgi:prolipoprotein diacylglyceryl transferase